MTLRSGLALLAVLAAASCAEPMTPEVVSHYDLEEVRGAQLPVTLASGMVVESGALSFDPDGTCLRVQESKNPVQPAQIRITMARCTWVQEGGRVLVGWTDGSPGTVGELDGKLLHLKEQGDRGEETYRASGE